MIIDYVQSVGSSAERATNPYLLMDTLRYIQIKVLSSTQE